MRVIGSRPDGVLLVGVGGGQAVLLNPAHGACSAPLDLQHPQVEQLGPWLDDGRALALVEGRQLVRVLDQARVVPLTVWSLGQRPNPEAGGRFGDGGDNGGGGNTGPAPRGRIDTGHPASNAFAASGADRGIEYVRKADNWRQVDLEPHATPEEAASMAKLPVYKSGDVLHTDEADGAYKSPMPQFHVLERPDGTHYGVNTEGFDYPRYLIRLPGGPSVPGSGVGPHPEHGQFKAQGRNEWHSPGGDKVRHVTTWQHEGVEHTPAGGKAKILYSQRVVDTHGVPDRDAEKFAKQDIKGLLQDKFGIKAGGKKGK